MIRRLTHPLHRVLFYSSRSRDAGRLPGTLLSQKSGSEESLSQKESEVEFKFRELHGKLEVVSTRQHNQQSEHNDLARRVIDIEERVKKQAEQIEMTKTLGIAACLVALPSILM